MREKDVEIKELEEGAHRNLNQAKLSHQAIIRTELLINIFPYMKVFSYSTIKKLTEFCGLQY